MAGRHDVRRVKIHRSYTISEAATLLGVHERTVRRWTDCGLPLIEDKRPYLIHGSDLRAFLGARRPKKQPCRPGEIYCVACRAPRRPAGDMADYIPRSATSGLLRGLCPECGALMNRMTRFASLSAASGDLDVARQPAQRRLDDSRSSLSNAHFNKDGL
ncbi:helix-turn-helix domain-containing protein [Methylosinus sp. Ce-a6]|uniref:helix-turn-helix domain-containing protein n=1 Tax=Methylosinus sp. Ce-a6 TaxID=2172005 RepID=UPI0013574DB0